jgi:hypothetical protein
MGRKKEVRSETPLSPISAAEAAIMVRDSRRREEEEARRKVDEINAVGPKPIRSALATIFTRIAENASGDGARTRAWTSATFRMEDLLGGGWTNSQLDEIRGILGGLGFSVRMSISTNRYNEQMDVGWVDVCWNGAT